MNLELAKSIRNIFFKCFLIGFFFLILSNLIYYLRSDFVLGMMDKIYGVAATDAKICIANAYTFFKIAVFVLFLIPAMAIQMEFFCPCKCKGSCSVEQKK